MYHLEFNTYENLYWSLTFLVLLEGLDFVFRPRLAGSWLRVVRSVFELSILDVSS